MRTDRQSLTRGLFRGLSLVGVVAWPIHAGLAVLGLWLAAGFLKKRGKPDGGLALLGWALSAGLSWRIWILEECSFLAWLPPVLLLLSFLHWIGAGSSASGWKNRRGFETIWIAGLLVFAVFATLWGWISMGLPVQRAEALQGVAGFMTSEGALFFPGWLSGSDPAFGRSVFSLAAWSMALSALAFRKEATENPNENVGGFAVLLAVLLVLSGSHLFWRTAEMDSSGPLPAMRAARRLGVLALEREARLRAARDLRKAGRLRESAVLASHGLRGDPSPDSLLAFAASLEASGLGDVALNLLDENRVDMERLQGARPGDAAENWLLSECWRLRNRPEEVRRVLRHAAEKIGKRKAGVAASAMETQIIRRLDVYDAYAEGRANLSENREKRPGGRAERSHWRIELTRNAWRGRHGADLFLPGEARAVFEAPGGAAVLELQARGTPAAGTWPEAALLLNGRELARFTVESPGETLHRFRVSTRPGLNRIGVRFLNDYANETEDRNLFLGPLRFLPDQANGGRP